MTSSGASSLSLASCSDAGGTDATAESSFADLRVATMAYSLDLQLLFRNTFIIVVQIPQSGNHKISTHLELSVIEVISDAIVDSSFDC